MHAIMNNTTYSAGMEVGPGKHQLVGELDLVRRKEYFCDDYWWEGSHHDYVYLERMG